jgi:hypothetical protein
MDNEYPTAIIADYSSPPALAICNFPVEGATITQLVLCITTLSASIASFFIFLCILWQRRQQNQQRNGKRGSEEEGEVPVELFDFKLPKIHIPGIIRKKRRVERGNHGQPATGTATLLKPVDA